MMGRVIYSMMVSLDGFVEAPASQIDWVIVDEEVHAHANAQARESGAFLYGRRLYELMAGYWPTADQDPSAPSYIVEFAQIWRSKPKIVFSTSLGTVGWNSRLVREVVPDQVAALKRQYGDLEIGGPTLAATFIRLGLVDDLRLYVNPILLGGGTSFLPPLTDRQHLRFVETRAFASGVVYLRYERREGSG